MVVRRWFANVAEFLSLTQKRRAIAGRFLRKFEVSRKLLPVFLLLAVLSGLFWWAWAGRSVCEKNCQPQIFVIKKGEGLSEIAQKLEDQGLVRSSFFFQIEATRLGVVRKIQAGDFRLNSSMMPSEIARLLTHGTLDRWVTIIEGLRREEIAEKLVDQLGGKDSKFSKEEFLEKTIGLEGRLFPDTYLFPKEATAERIISFMNLNFEKKTAGLLLKEEDLILASLIEREVRGANDQPIVAGILLKRLKASWPLQVDAAVQYAKATRQCRGKDGCVWWPKGLTKADLKIDSSYNTYLYQGLPPTPICNPGLSSIKAAASPILTDYWYYLSDREGKMHYAVTLEEHNKNIQKYLGKL